MSSEYIASPDDRILVTGSNGFIGSKVVEKLLEYGFANVRCFVRPSSRLPRLKEVLDRLLARSLKRTRGRAEVSPRASRMRGGLAGGGCGGENDLAMGSALPG